MSRAPSPITQLLPAPAAQTAGYDAITDFAKAGFQLQQVAKETKRKTDYNNFLAQMTEWDAEARVASNQAGTDQIQSTYDNTMRSRYEGYLNNNQEILQDTRLSRQVGNAFTTGLSNGNATSTASYAKRLGVDQHSSLMKMHASYLTAITESPTPKTFQDIQEYGLEYRKSLSESIGTSNGFVNNEADVERLYLEFMENAKNASQKGMLSAANENTASIYEDTANTLTGLFSSHDIENEKSVGNTVAVSNEKISDALAGIHSSIQSLVDSGHMTPAEGETKKKEQTEKLLVHLSGVFTNVNPLRHALMFDEDPSYFNQGGKALRSKLYRVASSVTDMRASLERVNDQNLYQRAIGFHNNPMNIADPGTGIEKTPDMNNPVERTAANQVFRDHANWLLNTGQISQSGYQKSINKINLDELTKVITDISVGLRKYHVNQGELPDIRIYEGLRDKYEAHLNTNPNYLPKMNKLNGLINDIRTARSAFNTANKIATWIVDGLPGDKKPSDSPRTVEGWGKVYDVLATRNPDLEDYQIVSLMGDATDDLGVVFPTRFWPKQIADNARLDFGVPGGQGRNIESFVLTHTSLNHQNRRAADSLLDTPTKRLFMSLAGEHIDRYLHPDVGPPDMDALKRDLGPYSQNPALRDLVAKFNNYAIGDTHKNDEMSQLNEALRLTTEWIPLREWAKNPTENPEYLANLVNVVKDPDSFTGIVENEHSVYGRKTVVLEQTLDFALSAYEKLSGYKVKNVAKSVQLSDAQNEDLIMRVAYRALELGVVEAGNPEEEKAILSSAIADVSLRFPERFVVFETTDVVDGETVRLMPRHLLDLSPGVEVGLVGENLNQSMVRHYDKTGFLVRSITGASIIGKEPRPDLSFASGPNKVAMPVHSLKGDASTDMEVVGFHEINKTNGEVEYISGEIAHRIGDMKPELDYFNGLKAVYLRTYNAHDVFRAQESHHYSKDYPTDASLLDKNIRVQRESQNYIIDTAKAAVLKLYGGRQPRTSTVDKDGRSYEVFADREQQDSYFRYLNQAALTLGYPEGWKVNSSEE